MSTILTLELLQSLDIQVGRLMGLLKDPKYRKLVKDYDLDNTQCLLWWDVSRLLSYIMDNNDYEDVALSDKDLGYETKKVLAEQDDKFFYIKQLLVQYDVLHENREVGKIIKETIEDIQIVYKSIEKDLDKIFTSQEEIQKIIRNKDQ